MIVKVQRPLGGTAEPAILVYNKDRSFEALLPYTEEDREWFGDRLKVYCEATVQGTDLVITREVEPQDW